MVVAAKKIIYFENFYLKTRKTYYQGSPMLITFTYLKISTFSVDINIDHKLMSKTKLTLSSVIMGFLPEHHFA